MKRILLLGALLLAACDYNPTDSPESGYNVVNCRQAVIEELKTTDVVQVPRTQWNWIARLPNGEVWWVETYGVKAKISAKTLLLK